MADMIGDELWRLKQENKRMRAALETIAASPTNAAEVKRLAEAGLSTTPSGSVGGK